MSLVTWDASYSVNVSKCDEDHKKLFSLLNSLDDSMRAGQGNDVIQRVVQELANYARYHFSHEELLMSKTKYPALSSHKAQHANFIKKVEEFQLALQAGSVTPPMKVAEFIKDWLAIHIKQTDRQYSSHLNVNGIS